MRFSGSETYVATRDLTLAVNAPPSLVPSSEGHEEWGIGPLPGPKNPIEAIISVVGPGLIGLIGSVLSGLLGGGGGIGAARAGKACEGGDDGDQLVAGHGSYLAALAGAVEAPAEVNRRGVTGVPPGACG